MKRHLLYLAPWALAGLLATPGHAEAKHLVLHEKFTNTGCSPCARYAPASDSLLNMRLGEVVPITYHGNYPSPNDEFYVANKAHIDARIAQYGITGYPSVVVNGQQVSYAIPSVDDAIDAASAQEQTMDLKLESSFENGVLKVKLTASPLKVMNNPNLRLFVCAVEDKVTPRRQAPNGQTEFHYEVRHFMQEPGGYDMGAFAELKPAVFENEWTVEGFDNTELMSIVAWIQDVSTGQVEECAYAPRSTDKADAAQVLLVQDTPDAICAPYYHATVTFRNNGNQPLTSCNICVNINGSIQKTPWQGNLGYLDKVTVTTPDFTEFDLDPDAVTNQCQIFISDINGSQEISDSYSVPFKNSVVGRNSVEVSVFTDNKPEETAWELYDATGTLLEKSEPFTEKRKFHKHIFNLPSDGCYRLRFTDKGGDGIVGQYGNGYYKLSQRTTDGKTKMIAQNDFAGAEHTIFFRLEDATTGLESVDNDNAMSWEGATRTLHIGLAGASVKAVDASGKQVYSGEGLSAIDCSSWAKGIYVISVTDGEQVITKTIIL